MAGPFQLNYVYSCALVVVAHLQLPDLFTNMAEMQGQLGQSSCSGQTNSFFSLGTVAKVSKYCQLGIWNDLSCMQTVMWMRRFHMWDVSM